MDPSDRRPLQRPQLTTHLARLQSVVMSAAVGYVYNYCLLLRDRCLFLGICPAISRLVHTM
jgi:hypothetical protein